MYFVSFSTSVIFLFKDPIQDSTFHLVVTLLVPFSLWQFQSFCITLTHWRIWSSILYNAPQLDLSDNFLWFNWDFVFGEIISRKWYALLSAAFQKVHSFHVLGSVLTLFVHSRLYLLGFLSYYFYFVSIEYSEVNNWKQCIYPAFATNFRNHWE